MREFAVRYVNGPRKGVGEITQPDDAGDQPPLVQRIPLPSTEQGVRRTISNVVGNQQHAIYERTGHNDAGEWEFTLVRVE